ncbi:DUF536 domain-containing protein, partial [Staphylococcus arlettae]|uniref:DUF536 domain-containing protein n=1 Tax=Staphylococcus arlettae TaxID=29378 RepID=UPI000D523EC0
TLNRLLENQQVLALESNKKIQKLENQLEQERHLNYSFDTSTNNMSKRFRNEGEPTQPQEPKKQGEEVTVEDVMDKLEEILEEVKKGNEGKEDNEPKEPKQPEQPQNSFARLFNMQTK